MVAIGSSKSRVLKKSFFFCKSLILSFEEFHPNGKKKPTHFTQGPAQVIIG